MELDLKSGLMVPYESSLQKVAEDSQRRKENSDAAEPDSDEELEWHMAEEALRQMRHTAEEKEQKNDTEKRQWSQYYLEAIGLSSEIAKMVSIGATTEAVCNPANDTSSGSRNRLPNGSSGLDPSTHVVQHTAAMNSWLDNSPQFDRRPKKPEELPPHAFSKSRAPQPVIIYSKAGASQPSTPPSAVALAAAVHNTLRSLHPQLDALPSGKVVVPQQEAAPSEKIVAFQLESAPPESVVAYRVVGFKNAILNSTYFLSAKETVGAATSFWTKNRKCFMYYQFSKQRWVISLRWGVCQWHQQDNWASVSCGQDVQTAYHCPSERSASSWKEYLADEWLDAEVQMVPLTAQKASAASAQYPVVAGVSGKTEAYSWMSGSAIDVDEPSPNSKDTPAKASPSQPKLPEALTLPPRLSLEASVSSPILLPRATKAKPPMPPTALKDDVPIPSAVPDVPPSSVDVAALPSGVSKAQLSQTMEARSQQPADVALPSTPKAPTGTVSTDLSPLSPSILAYGQPSAHEARDEDASASSTDTYSSSEDQSDESETEEKVDEAERRLQKKRMLVAKALYDPDPVKRAKVADTLGRMKGCGADYAREVASILEHPARDVRKLATSVLERMGERGEHFLNLWEAGGRKRHVDGNEDPSDAETGGQTKPKVQKRQKATKFGKDDVGILPPSAAVSAVSASLQVESSSEVLATTIERSAQEPVKRRRLIGKYTPALRPEQGGQQQIAHPPGGTFV